MYKVKQLIMLSTKDCFKNLELDENYMYALTDNNYKKIKELISIDSKYNKSEQKYSDNGKGNPKKIIKADLKGFIGDINSESSTRADSETIKKLAEIMNEYAKKDHSFNNSDIDIIVKKLYEKTKKRHERSLVSKVIKYYELYANNNEDGFAVNDAIVRTVLPYYLKYYDVIDDFSKYPTNDKMTYQELCGLFNLLQEKMDNKLTKHKIDQIIWYCYKDDDVRLALVKAMFLDKSNRLKQK